MTITLSPAELRALGPCSDRTHLFGERSRMNAAQALSAGATIPDLLWVAALIYHDLIVKRTRQIMAKTKFPAAFGPSYPGNYPAEMRRQLWPLCCGASILSGFKSVNKLTDKELLADILAIVAKDGPVPDHQVFLDEIMRPALTFLTLNSGQMKSPKIMKAIEAAGFVSIGTAKPRGFIQGFFVRDTSNSWEPSK